MIRSCFKNTAVRSISILAVSRKILNQMRVIALLWYILGAGGECDETGLLGVERYFSHPSFSPQCDRFGIKTEQWNSRSAFWVWQTINYHGNHVHIYICLIYYVFDNIMLTAF